mmetsp:Transcript_12790/g.30611  ORF Transcript_12790/g.30611 Transcript_12790/m.30611 type:complete len:181 (-) Transcript_12790:21-563(-)
MRASIFRIVLTCCLVADSRRAVPERVVQGSPPQRASIEGVGQRKPPLLTKKAADPADVVGLSGSDEVVSFVQLASTQSFGARPAHHMQPGDKNKLSVDKSKEPGAKSDKKRRSSRAGKKNHHSKKRPGSRKALSAARTARREELLDLYDDNDLGDIEDMLHDDLHELEMDFDHWHWHDEL